MAFFIQTVERCPIASGSAGVVEIKPEILGMLAGAVQDPDEWLVLLLGEVRMRGLHVIVNEIYVPTKQERGGAHCSTKEDLPPQVTSRLVGVLHSHHHFAAEFSPTDRGKDG